MTYPKRELEVIPECNDEHDNPRCWAMLVSEIFDRRHYIWISQYSDDEFVIENSDGYNLCGKVTYKTLAGAKRKAEEIAYRQDDTGFFTD